MPIIFISSVARIYDALALVQIVGEGPNLQLDECRIYLIPKDAVLKGYYPQDKLDEYRLCNCVVDGLFAAR